MKLLEWVLPERSHELMKLQAGATEEPRWGRCSLQQPSLARACAGHWIVRLERPSPFAAALLPRVQSACPVLGGHAWTPPEAKKGSRIGPTRRSPRSQQGCTMQQ